MAPGAENPRVELTPNTVTSAVANLQRACAALARRLDVTPLSQSLTNARVLEAAVAAAPPSPDEARLWALLAGGLAGLRAFVHLSTEAACLRLAKMDPFTASGVLERQVTACANELDHEARIMARHRALFATSSGQDLWCQAHAQGVLAELALVEAALAASEPAFSREIIFWYDPGSSAEEIAANAPLCGLTKRDQRADRTAQSALLAHYRTLEHELTATAP